MTEHEKIQSLIGSMTEQEATEIFARFNESSYTIEKFMDLRTGELFGRPNGAAIDSCSTLKERKRMPETTYEKSLRVNPAVWGRIETLLGLLPPETASAHLDLLDLGAAAGTWADYLPRHWNYCGFEGLASRVEEGRARGRALTQALLPEALYRLPPASRSVVTAWFFLEHLNGPDLCRTLLETARILALGGVFALAVPNAAGSFARFRPSAARAADDPFHFQHFTPASLRRLLKPAGFRVLSVKITGLHPERVGLPRKPWILALWKVLGLGDTFEVYASLKRRPADVR